MKRCVALLLVFLLISGIGVFAKDTVTVMGVWGGVELEAFEKVMETFEAATGIEVEFEGTRTCRHY